MSAQDTTRAPSAPTLDDAQLEAREVMVADCATVRFFDRLQDMVAGVESPTEPHCFSIEHALQKGFEPINDDATLYAVSERDLAAAFLQMRERHRADAELLREIVGLVHKLDRAINGIAAAGVSVGAIPRLQQLVDQVLREQPVRILNLADGMRVNFRAPDGQRATLHVGAVIAAAETNGPIVFEAGDHDIPATMRAAIASYPAHGEPVIEETIYALRASSRARDFECKYCGLPSDVDPSDQTRPVDYCHPADHEAPQ